MHMKSSTGLEQDRDFGELHTSILQQGIPSILDLKPSRPKLAHIDSKANNHSPFLPHLSPGTNPILQYALSPVSYRRSPDQLIRSQKRRLYQL